MSSKRNFLSLKDKLKVIEEAKKGISARKLAERYGCGRTQFIQILKKSEDYVVKSLRGASLQSKTKRRKTVNEELNGFLREWLSHCRAKNLPISGPMLQESGQQIAERLRISDFKADASNGWFEKFRSRNGIVFRKMNGESVDTPVEDVSSWMNALPSIIADYDAKMYTTVTRSDFYIVPFLIKQYA